MKYFLSVPKKCLDTSKKKKKFPIPIKPCAILSDVCVAGCPSKLLGFSIIRKQVILNKNDEKITT